MNRRNLILILVLLILALAVVAVFLMLEPATEPEAPVQQPTVEADKPVEETPQAPEMPEVPEEPTEEPEQEQEVVTERMYSSEINDVFKHCIQVLETDEGGLYPVRFSEKRLMDYENYPVMPYSGCSAGITMEFTTDAEVISFDYEMKRNVWGSGFDVYENGELMEYIEVGSRKWGRFEYTRKSTEETSDIIICFPVASEAVVLEPQLGNFKTDVTGDKAKVLVLGDSISQGLFGSTPSRNWIFLLAQEQNLDYLNLSVGGETFRRAALDDDVPYEPDHIIVALGTNDLFYTRYVNVIEKDVHDYLDRLVQIYPDVPVTLITPFPQQGLSAKSNMFNSTRYNAMTEILTEAAEEYGFGLIDGSTLFPCDVAHFAPNDGVHPSSLGFESIAKNLNKQLTIVKKP